MIETNEAAEELKKRVSDLEAQIRKLKKRSLGLVFEDKPETIVEECKFNVPVLKEITNNRLSNSPKLPNNILIEGDNYLSLTVLNYTHKESIDLIYIDPPYNTGAKNWKYNNDYVDKDDEYRHSKWLSFMRHRLLLAKNLLKPDGVLICAIDENEQAHLNVLLEQTFPAHEIHSITIVHNPKGVQGKNFSYTHEYAIFVVPKNKKVIGERLLTEDEIYVSNLRNWGNESERSDAKNCFYPIIIKNNQIIGFGEVADDSFHPEASNQKLSDGSIYVWPIDEKGIERKWRYARQSVEKIKDILQIKTGKNGVAQIMIAKDYGTYKTVWDDKKYDASEYGTKLLREILPGCDFDYPKSLYTVYDCLFAVIGNKPNAVVLDFFAGSGTTGHAVLEMNKMDGGQRKFILCTNNENNNDGEGGIAQTVCYPRVKAVISGWSTKKKEKIAGIPANIFYFETDLLNLEDLQRASDQSKVNLALRSGEIIALREDTLFEEEHNDWWQLFSGNNKLTAIYFKEDKSQLPMLLKKLEKEKKTTALYIFSWGKNEYRSEYSSTYIKVYDIPEPIIEVYRELNRF